MKVFVAVLVVHDAFRVFVIVYLVVGVVLSAFVVMAVVVLAGAKVIVDGVGWLTLAALFKALMTESSGSRKVSRSVSGVLQAFGLG